MRRLFFVGLLALTLFLIIYPSAFLNSTISLPDTNDTRLMSYIIGQVQTNLLERNPLYFGTFFAPFPNALTYSDLFLTSAIITLPMKTLLNLDPISIFNLTLILGFVLTFVCSYLFFSSVSKSDYLGLLGTILFNLSGYHFSYLPHIQVFNLWPVFLSLYFFQRYLSEDNRLLLLAFFVTTSLQVFESVFLVYLLFFASFILYLCHHKTQSARIKNSLAIVQLSILFIPFWILFLFPYLKLNQTFPEASRPIRDAAHFSLGLEEVFTKYHSWPLLFMSLTSAVFARKDLSRITSWLWVSAFSLIMSFGPVIKLFGKSLKLLGLPIPLPYTAFYYLFPGFTGFRTPSRFIILFAIGLTAITILNLRKLVKLKSFSKFVLISFVTSICLIDLDIPRLGYKVNPYPPKIYSLLDTLDPSSIILELPIYLWNDPGHEVESLRSLYSLNHQLRRIGGFSGFSPLAWIDLVQKLKTYGLDQENLNQLKTFGVTHILQDDRLTPLY